MFAAAAARLRRAHRESGSRGQFLVIFAAGMIVFLGFVALVVDGGMLYVARRDYQNATDSAALAGAAYLTRPLADPCADVPGTSKQVCARRAAWNYLNDNLNLGLADATATGYAAVNTAQVGQVVTPGSGGFNYRIWVSTPPNAAGTAAVASTVGTEQRVLFVRVDRQRELFFGRILVPDGFTVSAWSTAGVNPDRYAIITLRRGRGGSDIDAGPSNTKDIDLSGTNSTLSVVNADVGGNYGMKLNAGSTLKIYSTNGDTADVFLIDHTSCGNSCWGVSQIQDQAGNPVAPKKLRGFIPDPNYQPPPIPSATWPTGPIDNPSPTLDIPNGDTSASPFGASPSVTISTGSLNAAGKCVGPSGTTADAPRLGPGTYDSITVRSNSCVVLDPVNRHSNPGALTDVATPIPATQLAGVYYIHGQLDIRQGALMVGDGVSIFIRPASSGGSQFSPGSGGVVDLNTGFQSGTAQKLGAWTTRALSPYSWNGLQWAYQAGLEGSPGQNGIGIALYVLKPSQAGFTDANGTDVVQVTSGAGLAWKGVTYAPHDNVKISGQPLHAGLGQLISWTFTFTGGTSVTQTFEGPGDGFPYLIEPCVQVSGSCQ